MINWSAIGAITAVVVGVPSTAAYAASRVTNWRKRHEGDLDRAERLWTAVFGKAADPPYDAVDGVIAEAVASSVVVKDHEQRLGRVEKILVSIQETLTTLVPDGNGGHSMADKINRIDAYVAAQMEKG